MVFQISVPTVTALHTVTSQLLHIKYKRMTDVKFKEPRKIRKNYIILEDFIFLYISVITPFIVIHTYIVLADVVSTK